MASKDWQAREKKLNKRRDIKEQKRFYKELKPDQTKVHKAVMKEKDKQRERSNEDEDEVETSGD